MTLERALFGIFLICLISCASMVLFSIWFKSLVPGPWYFQIIATLFVTGLASFLVWFSMMLYAFRRKHESP